MSISFSQPAPILIVNDETGEFVMTHNILSVEKCGYGSYIYMRSHGATSGKCVESELSPDELRCRLFDLGE